MGKIRVGGSTKIIEVNDDGDTITLPVGDDHFLSHFLGLVNKTREKAASVKVDESDILGALESVVEFDKAMASDVDALFGPGTCKKVFGLDVPGMEMFIEFFSLLMPYIQEGQQARMARMNKYSAGRVGSCGV